MKKIIEAIKWPVLLGMGFALLVLACGAPKQTVRQDEAEGADVDVLLGLTEPGEQQKPEQKEPVAEKKEGGLTEQEVLDMFNMDEKAQKPPTETKKDDTQGQIDSEIARLNAAEAAEGTVETRDGGEAEAVPPATDIVWKATSFQGRYEEALETYRASKYQDAIQRFEALLNTGTKHLLSVNCQYWIGESYYGLTNYQQAIVAFEKVFTFEKEHKDDDAQLKLGICYYRMNDRERAKQEFQKLLDAYPESEYVSRARAFIRQIE